MQQGAEALARGRADAAREAQRRAAEAAERGAGHAEDLATALRSDRPGDADPGPSPGELASAREAQRRASQELSSRAGTPSDSARAAEPSMRSAARGLRAASQSAPPGGRPGVAEPSLADGTATDPSGATAGPGSADLSRLQDAVRRKTGRAWGELPGHLRTELLQLSQGRYRDDYARLIQLYYREIAADAGQP